MGAAQEKRLKELERKVELFAEQRMKLEAQAETQLSRGRARGPALEAANSIEGSAGSSGSSAPALPSDAPPEVASSVSLENGAKMQEAEEPVASGLANTPLMDLQQSASSLPSKSVADGPKSEFVLEMERERELWEAKMAGLNARVDCSKIDGSRPGSASSAPAAEVVQSGSSGSLPGNGRPGSRPWRSSGACTTSEVEAPSKTGSALEIAGRLEISEEAAGQLGEAPEVAEQLEIGDNSGCGPASVGESVEVVLGEEASSTEEGPPGGLIAAALRAAGLETSSPEEAAAELLRRARAELPPSSEQEGSTSGGAAGGRAQRPASGGSARRWAAERLRRKRGGMRTPGSSAAPSRAATPALPTCREEASDDGASEASP